MAILNFTEEDFTAEVDYMTIWEFEKQAEWAFSSRDILEENPWIPIYIIIVYLSTTYIGQRIMKNRAPFDLTRALAGWNFMLAGFSILAFSRTFPELFNTFNLDDGFYLSVCKRL